MRTLPSPKKGETLTTAPTVSGPKFKHKQTNDTHASKEHKAPKIGVPFHGTPPDLIKALRTIRDALPGCSARVQEERLERALRIGALTSFEMLKYLDLYDPRARIQGLRLAGHDIIRTWVVIETDCGQRHRVGRFTMRCGCVTAPEPGQADLFGAAVCAEVSA